MLMQPKTPQCQDELDGLMLDVWSTIKMIGASYDFCASNYRDALREGDVKAAKEFSAEMQRIEVTMHDYGDDIWVKKP